MSELFAYKIMTRDQWDAFREQGVFHGAAVDLTDGYIHLSARDQVTGTLERHFSGQDDLILAMVDLAALGDMVKWEESRGGALFPHIYGSLPMSAITTKAKLRLDETGRHVLPAGFAEG